MLSSKSAAECFQPTKQLVHDAAAVVLVGEWRRVCELLVVVYSYS